jgi:hypothetical protein
MLAVYFRILTKAVAVGVLSISLKSNALQTFLNWLGNADI